MAGFPSLIGLVLLLACGETPTQHLLDCAEQSFAVGRAATPGSPAAHKAFALAADYYDDLIKSGIQNADLFRDLGNASLLAGDLPRAIMAYRRGLHLAPGQQDLLTALEYARAQVSYSESGTLARPPSAGWLDGTFHVLQAGFYFGLILYSATCVLAAHGWLRSRRLPASRVARLSCVALFGLAIAAIAVGIDQRRRQDEDQHPLVVIKEDGVLLRKGNGLSYPRRIEMPLNRGVEARLLTDRDQWLQVELGSGEVGWVPRAYVIVDSR